MTAASDWSVVESDDEWQQYNSPHSSKSTDATTSGAETKGANESSFMPTKLALLFKEIEQKRVLPLNCTCPRVGTLKNTTTSSDRTPPQQPVAKENEKNQPGDGPLENEQKDIVETSKVYEAFEFDDENDRGPASAKRKTPASGVKRVKKEKASLSNVVNDIRRQKILDDMEAAAKPDAPPETPDATAKPK